MSTSKSKSTKRRTKVKDLPKKEKKLSTGDMKKVKGGNNGPFSGIALSAKNPLSKT